MELNSILLRHPLKRTRQEIEVAMSNAKLARQFVFELFQDLEGFNLGDYKRCDDQGRGMRRLVSFAQRAARLDGGQFENSSDGMYALELPDVPSMLFTTDREAALTSEEINLLGLEHPIIQSWLDKFSNLPADARAVRLASPEVSDGMLTIWQVFVQAAAGIVNQRVVRLGITPDGTRSTQIERLGTDLLSLHGAQNSNINLEEIAALVNGAIALMLRRDLAHAGILTQEASFSKKLIGLVELVGERDCTLS